MAEPEEPRLLSLPHFSSIRLVSSVDSLSGGAADDQQAAYMTALGYTFLIKALWAE